MSNSEIKNPIFICLIAVVLGAATAVIGWIKYDSTKASATHGSITMMIIGGAFLVAGLAGWQIFGNRK
jgi:hypothetical protein